MTRFVVVDLHDEFPQIAFDDIDTGGLHGVGQFDFFADHRLAFDGGLAVAAHENVENDLSGLGPVGGKMHLAAVFLDVALELLQVIIQMIQRVLFDFAGQGAKGVGLGQITEPHFAALVLPHNGTTDGGFEPFVAGGLHALGMKIKLGFGGGGRHVPDYNCTGPVEN